MVRSMGGTRKKLKDKIETVLKAWNIPSAGYGNKIYKENIYNG